jgi:hypothetical protein
MNRGVIIHGEAFLLKPGFRWTPSMLDLDGWRLLRISRSDGSWMAYSFLEDRILEIYRPSVPDLSDPATIGCLISLARHRTRNPYLSFRNSIGRSEIEGILECLE